MLTFLPIEQINEMDKWEGSQLNQAKEILAYELTALVHGEEEAKKAQEGARALFSSGSAEHMPTAELTAEDFYHMEIGSAGIMRAYMAQPCDETFTLEKKLAYFLTMSLRAYKVPEAELQQVLAFIKGLQIREISEKVMHELFSALAMRFAFTL